MIDMTPSGFIISRTDSIGDVVLTLPLCGYLKKYFPHTPIVFIGQRYTQPIVEACTHVDTFMEVGECLAHPALLASHKADVIVHVFPNRKIADLARKVGIRYRIGTSHRWFHWFTCNRLVSLSRKKSALHEAQLNFKLLKGLDIEVTPPLEQIPTLYGIKAPYQADIERLLIKNDKPHIVLHPKSRGSAQEWGLAQYKQLSLLLAPFCNIYITGTAQEGALIRQEMPAFFDDSLTDMTGKLTLTQLLAFINQTDGLVACSTGPLHLAAALGKIAIGMYAWVRPIHAGRWGAIGSKTVILEKESVKSITPQEVCQAIISML